MLQFTAMDDDSLIQLCPNITDTTKYWPDGLSIGQVLGVQLQHALSKLETTVSVCGLSVGIIAGQFCHHSHAPVIENKRQIFEWFAGLGIPSKILPKYIL